MDGRSPSLHDIMTKEVISVHPETSVFKAHEIMEEHRFDGVPVVDQDNVLVGILTEYDLIAKGSSVHLPTLQKVLAELPVHEKDRPRFFKDAVEEIMKLRVRDVMNPEPLSLPENTTLESVIAAFRGHHRVNPIPVVDTENRVVGVVSRYDVLKLFTMLRMSVPEL